MGKRDVNIFTFYSSSRSGGYLPVMEKMVYQIIKCIYSREEIESWLDLLAPSDADIIL